MAPPRKFNSLASWRNAENSLHSINLTMPSACPCVGSLARSGGISIVMTAPMVDYKIHWLKMMSVPESRAVVGRHDGINGRDTLLWTTGTTPQHRVPHNVKWTSFAPPGWTNFAPPLTPRLGFDQFLSVATWTLPASACPCIGSLARSGGISIVMTAPMVDYKIHWLKMMSVPESRAVVGRHDGINGRDRQTATA